MRHHNNECSCRAAGTYIYTWEFAFDTFLAPGLFEDEEVSTLTYIAGMCTRNRTNVQGGQLLQPVQSPAPNRYTKAKIVSNATELAVVSSGSGFGSFALTCARPSPVHASEDRA